MQATSERNDHADQQQAWDAEQQREDHARFRAKVRALQNAVSEGEAKVLELRQLHTQAKGDLREAQLKLRQLLEGDARPLPLFDQGGSGHAPEKPAGVPGHFFGQDVVFPAGTAEDERPLIGRPEVMGTPLLALVLPDSLRQRLQDAEFTSLEEVRDHAAMEGRPLAEFLAACVPGLDLEKGRTIAEAIAVALEKQGVYSCKVCGCTQDNCEVCVERTGEPCYWSGPLLCSACASGHRRRQKKEKKAAKTVRQPAAQAEEEASADAWKQPLLPTGDDVGAWMRDVRDPASASEGAKWRHFLKIGDCEAEYQIAPGIGGGEALRYRLAAGDLGNLTPWQVYRTHAACKEAFMATAQAFFAHAAERRDLGKKTAANVKKMLARLEKVGTDDLPAERVKEDKAPPAAHVEQTPEGTVTTTVEVLDECKPAGNAPDDWERTVRDPAEAHELARYQHVIAAVKGAADCRLLYRVAPVPSGVAITWRLERKGGGELRPWHVCPSRPDCLIALAESARRFFKGAHTKLLSRIDDIAQGREPAREPVPGPIEPAGEIREGGPKPLAFGEDHKQYFEDAATFLESSRRRWDEARRTGLSDEDLTDALAEIFGKGPSVYKKLWESSAAPAFRVGTGGWMSGAVLLALAREVLGVGRPPEPEPAFPSDTSDRGPAGQGTWRYMQLIGLFPSEQVKQLARSQITSAGQLADYVASGKSLTNLPGVADGLNLLIIASLRGFWVKEVLGGTGLLPDWLRPKEEGRKARKPKGEAPAPEAPPAPAAPAPAPGGGLFDQVEADGAYAPRPPKKKAVKG